MGEESISLGRWEERYQRIGITIGEMSLPCASCGGAITEHSITVEEFDTMLWKIDIGFQCLDCQWKWTRGIHEVDHMNDVGFLTNFAKIDQELWEGAVSIAETGHLPACL